MVADGMSASVPALAEAFSYVVRDDGQGTRWRELAARDDIVRGFFDMTSLNSLVTDSSAASSSWGSGSRIFNFAVNMLPDGRPLTPIAPLARSRGRRVGLVTTTRLTHATPAGFAAVAPSRDLEADIATQYPDRVDVLLGGGAKHFSPALRKDRRDVFADYRAAGFAVFDSRDGLLERQPRAERLLGVFASDHLPFTIDRAREPALQQRVPTLAEMTRCALGNLALSNDGFLLQVEGGRVDHAAHDNDAAAMLHDQLAFDDAIGVVMAFAREYPDTLVIITTDHGTGNPGLNGMGSKYQRSNRGLEVLARSIESFESMHARLSEAAKATGVAPDGARVGAVVRDATGIDIRPQDAALLAGVFAKKPPAIAPEISMFQADIAGLLGQMLGNHTGITFTGIVHTSDWALSLAFGPGAARFGGLRANTDAFEIMTEFMGIEHRNPRMSADEAKKFAAAAPSHDRYA
jgi:alkaline phosphatase